MHGMILTGASFVSQSSVKVFDSAVCIASPILQNLTRSSLVKQDVFHSREIETVVSKLSCSQLPGGRVKAWSEPDRSPHRVEDTSPDSSGLGKVEGVPADASDVARQPVSSAACNSSGVLAKSSMTSRHLVLLGLKS